MADLRARMLKAISGYVVSGEGEIHVDEADDVPAFLDKIAAAVLDEVDQRLDQKVAEDEADPPANPYWSEALMIFRGVREEIEGSRDGEPRDVG